MLDQVRVQAVSSCARIESGIDEAIKDYATRGFCLSYGDWDADIASVGVPFTAPDGTQMAFNCGGPAFVLSRDKLENDIGPRLAGLVKRVDAAIGRR